MWPLPLHNSATIVPNKHISSKELHQRKPLGITSAQHMVRPRYVAELVVMGLLDFADISAAVVL